VTSNEEQKGKVERALGGAAGDDVGAPGKGAIRKEKKTVGARILGRGMGEEDELKRT